MKCTLIVYDELNVQFVGLQKKHTNKIIEKTKVFVKGAQHSAAYRIGSWNGKESQFNTDGSTLFYMLDTVVPLVESFGYDIQLDDRRKSVEFSPEPVQDNIFSEYGISLRYYQVDAINAVIESQKGIIKAATSSGKTLICAALSKAYEPSYRSLVIVPSENLANQTEKEYNSVGVECGVIHGKISKKKKVDEWNKRHVVVTWQTLKNNREHLQNFDVILFDEAHVCGDVMYDVLENDLRHAHIRVGLTGTPPKDKYKRTKLYSRLGGDILYEINPKKLMDEGHIANVSIKIHPIQHQVELESLEWDSEFDYLMNNTERREAIVDFIRSLPKTNTLILTHAKFGAKLAEELGQDFIDKDVDPKVREEYFKQYSSKTDYSLVATWGTVGTGISINDIYQLVMIDVGKDHVKFIQGIGRSCRLDSKGLNSVTVHDLYSNLTYSERHFKERKREYNREKFDYNIMNPILVAP